MRGPGKRAVRLLANERFNLADLLHYRLDKHPLVLEVGGLFFVHHHDGTFVGFHLSLAFLCHFLELVLDLL